MKSFFLAFVVTVIVVPFAFAVSGCGQKKAGESLKPQQKVEPKVSEKEVEKPEDKDTTNKFYLKSPAFENGERMPTRFAKSDAGGLNNSPPLEWGNAPRGTLSFALVCIDRHPVANNWVHWMVINIPASTTTLPEGASPARMPEGSVELANSYGELGWGGPLPPPGTGEHEYEFTLYALKIEKLDFLPRATLDEFYGAIEGKVISKATLVGKFGR